jgi:hypothetical protein
MFKVLKTDRIIINYYKITELEGVEVFGGNDLFLSSEQEDGKKISGNKNPGFPVFGSGLYYGRDSGNDRVW